MLAYQTASTKHILAISYWRHGARYIRELHLFGKIPDIWVMFWSYTKYKKDIFSGIKLVNSMRVCTVYDTV